jgi:hypothetical protein
VSRKGYRPNLRELGLFDWVVNTVGVGVALEMLLTGEPISAERALTADMVAQVVPHEKLMEETDARRPLGADYQQFRLDCFGLTILMFWL